MIYENQTVYAFLVYISHGKKENHSIDERALFLYSKIQARKFECATLQFRNELAT